MSAPDGTAKDEVAPSIAAPSTARISLAHELALRLGALSIEPALRRVTHDDGREEVVEPRVMQVLVALIRAGGRIVSRDELLMSCWHGVVVGEDAINRVMGRVRRLTDGIGDGEIKLETVTKVGYRLVASGRATEVRPAPLPVAAAADRRVSICVLPFANMSDDLQQEYFSDGISEDIITDLAKVSALSVTARGTAFTFKGKAVDVPQIARQLNVTHVLEGSVRTAGGRVRITAQLIDGAAGDHVWGERWDRELTDIFALQDEISEAVVRALRLKLLPKARKAIERRGTESAEAYDLYLMGRQNQWGGKWDSRQFDAVVRLCCKAVEVDPTYARAWALMGRAQVELRFNLGRSDIDSWVTVETALSLAPDLAEAHALKGIHLIYQGRLKEAADAVETALRLDPESFDVNSTAGMLRIREERFAEAIPHYERLVALMENDCGFPSTLITCYAAIGDVEGVRSASRMTLARAEAMLELDRNNGAAMGYGVKALAALGEADRCRNWIRRALLIDPDNLLMRYAFAAALAAHLKDPDGALDLLGPYFARTSSTWLAGDVVDPDLASLRQTPRFRTMVADAEARLAATGAAG